MIQHHGVSRPAARDLVDDQALASPIHLGHEIDGSALRADLQRGLIAAPLEVPCGARKAQRELQDRRGLRRRLVQGAGGSGRRKSLRALAAVARATSPTPRPFTAASTWPTCAT